MSFKRKDAVVEASDLRQITASQAERKIIDAVRKYATRQDNWSQADKNTSFLGSVTGMGIESSNQVDIVMNIERLFLTRKTKRVPVNGGPERLVAANVREAFWDVADTGIFFIVTDAARSPAGPGIRRYDFTSGLVSTLATLGPHPLDVLTGFSVSRDGRAVLWTHTDTLQDDLMLIDPWK